jgi:hypothetical protein
MSFWAILYFWLCRHVSSSHFSAHLSSAEPISLGSDPQCSEVTFVEFVFDAGSALLVGCNLLHFFSA